MTPVTEGAPESEVVGLLKEAALMSHAGRVPQLDGAVLGRLSRAAQVRRRVGRARRDAKLRAEPKEFGLNENDFNQAINK